MDGPLGRKRVEINREVKIAFEISRDIYDIQSVNFGNTTKFEN